MDTFAGLGTTTPVNIISEFGANLINLSLLNRFLQCLN